MLETSYMGGAKKFMSVYKYVCKAID